MTKFRLNLFFATYCVAFFASLMGLIFLPDDRESIRLVAVIVVYGTGLPLLVSFLLVKAVKSGMLTDGSAKRVDDQKSDS